MDLPAETDDAFERALATKPQQLKSLLTLQADKTLPAIPMASQQAYQGQMRNLLFHYMTTPGIGERDLTEEEESLVTSFEIGLWNFCKRFRSEFTDFTERKWLAEMVMGPVVQRNENVNLNVTQDWRKEMSAKGQEVAEVMAKAKALEAEIEDAEVIE